MIPASFLYFNLLSYCSTQISDFSSGYKLRLTLKENNLNKDFIHDSNAFSFDFIILVTSNYYYNIMHGSINT